MPAPDLIIFDYDGVVADSEILNNIALAEVLTQAGLPTTTDDVIAAYMGKRWIDFRDQIADRLGRPCDHLLGQWTDLQNVSGCHEPGGRRERRDDQISMASGWKTGNLDSHTNRAVSA